MRIILKHTLKNIFGKPGRTLLVLICISMCSLAAMFSLDLSGSIRNLMTSMYSSFFGSTDMIVYGNEKSMTFIGDENIPQYRSVSYSFSGDVFYTPVEGEYGIIKEEYVDILTMDYEKGVEFGMFQKNLVMGEQETIITKTLAETFGFEVGDTILVRDNNYEQIEYTVAGIEDLTTGLASGNTMLLSAEGMSRLMPDYEPHACLIDFLDDSKRIEVKKYLEEEYPDVQVEFLFDSEYIEEELNQITELFTLLFAICLLMVIFVTVSVSDRIVCERMAVIGTLRSLGFSSKLTSMVLLLENAAYGLIGGLIGIGLYAAIRYPLLDSMTSVDESVADKVTTTFGSISVAACIAVIVFCIVLECMCSIKEITKAVKTSVRDIIFSNKDSAYKSSKSSTIIGIVLAVIGVICLFLRDNVPAQIVAIVCCDIAFALLLPYLIRFVGKGLRAFFDKKQKPVLALACTESYTKKNTVGACVMIGTVSALCIVVINFASALANDVQDAAYFTSDISIHVLGGEEKDFRYLERMDNIKEVEYVYGYDDTIKVGDEDKEIYFQIFRNSENEDGFHGMAYFDHLPLTINEDEAVISQEFARKYGLKVGDTMHLTLQADMYLPIERDFKIIAVERSEWVDNGMVLNPKTFDRLYPKYTLKEIEVFTDEPDEIFETVKKYSSNYISVYNTYTQQSFKDEMERSAGTMINVIILVIALGIGVTFVGSAGNLLIGFEARKRECAVLLSTSMTRKQLSKMLYTESFLASFMALLVSVPMGYLLLVAVENVMNSYGSPLEFNPYPLQTMALWGVMLLVFTLTARAPVKKLKKMNLAEQLKYE